VEVELQRKYVVKGFCHMPHQKGLSGTYAFPPH